MCEQNEILIAHEFQGHIKIVILSQTVKRSHKEFQPRLSSAF